MAFEAYDPVGGETRRFKTRAAAEKWIRGLGYQGLGDQTIIEIHGKNVLKTRSRPAGYCRICMGPHKYKHGRK